MKRVFALFLLVFLVGCSAASPMTDRVLDLRARLLSNTCSFRTRITADYGDKTYTFTLDCTTDRSGQVSFTVSEPESIAGITGTLAQEGGKLTFDSVALDIALVADGQLAPVSAPWLLIHTLQSGCIVASGKADELTHLIIDESYADDAMTLDIWVDQEDRPVRADVSWQGRRILAMEVEDFTYL